MNPAITSTYSLPEQFAGKLLLLYFRRDMFEACSRAIRRDHISDQDLEMIVSAFGQLNQELERAQPQHVKPRFEQFYANIAMVRNIPLFVKSLFSVYQRMIQEQFHKI